MKKLIIIALAAFMMTGCGGVMQMPVATPQEKVVNDNREAGNNTADSELNAGQENGLDTEEVAEIQDGDFETKGYLYENGIGDTLYLVTIKNKSDRAAEVSINGTAYDESGGVVGAANGYIDVLGAEEQSIAVLYFSDSENIDHVECDYSYSPTIYTPVINGLQVEQNINNENVTVIVTNNGKYTAEFVEAHAIFFDAEGNVVYYSSEYITDNDSELKIGATQSAQLSSYEAFDHVECYLTGRSDGSQTEAQESIDVDNFDVKEYMYDTGYGSYMYFLAITNNSENVVGVSGNATAFDADGNVVGSANCSLDVLGKGEKGLTYFYFDAVENVDHVEYQLEYPTDLYWDPVVANISVEENVNKENVVLRLTNNGDVPAEFLEAHALFLDANDQVIYYESGYAIDNDSELKPGASQSVQLSSYEAFDHVECFLSGRHSKN